MMEEEQENTKAGEESRLTSLKRLQEQRQALLVQIELNALPEIDQMTYGSQAEAASDVYEQQRVLTFRRHLEGQLREVEEAIERLQRGMHGICESCGRPISPERLEILPEAKLCVSCQRLRESRR